MGCGRWPAVGLGIAGCIILGSSILSFLVHYLGEYPPTMLLLYPDPRDMHEMWKAIYMQTWNHAGAYFVGVVAGYLLISGAHKKYIHNPKVRLAGWILAAFVNCTILFVTYHWNRGNVPHPVVSLVYAAVHRPLWALGLSWMALCCVEGRAVIINTFLSWKAWVPLSRLVFMIYLIHYPLMIIFNGMLDEFRFSHQMMVWWFFGHFGVTLMLAMPACLVFESPFIRLEKLMMGGAKVPVPPAEKPKLDKLENGDGFIYRL